ncbi:MAG: hypothetical protein HMLKMBBP_03571 [Planctomycetes bacterium]|nr:hypothetical protein [Planctomycetota bacterium]
MNLPRRRLPALFAAAVVAAGAAPFLAGGDAASQEGPPPEPVSLVTEASRRAATKAVQWLVRNQQTDAETGQGWWTAMVGSKLNDGYQLEFDDERPHVGVTALAGTALLTSGSTPGRGPHAKQVERAIEFLLANQDGEGFISAHRSRMYSHAFATMFLAEVYGMTRDRRVRAALQEAVAFTCKAQNREGGWRYVPNAEDSDMSITVCQVMALRAAKNKGIAVPKEHVDAAVEYVMRSAVTRDAGEFERGAFLYQYRSKNLQAAANTRTSFALTAAGLTTLYGAGIYNDRDIADFVRNRKLDLGALPEFKPMLLHVYRHYEDVDSSRHRNHYYFWYGNYYAVQAMYIAGGSYWKSYFERVRDELVRSQRADGSWRDDLVGSAFATAVGAIILQVPHDYLPIFQR